jgi:hypothetical protein
MESITLRILVPAILSAMGILQQPGNENRLPSYFVIRSSESKDNCEDASQHAQSDYQPPQQA